ncbi:MAG: sigma factor-like helix-turn-helix DNA-binding protein, partial [bacterium]
MSTISFKPKKVTKKIISQLAVRASDVIMNRFGLTPDGEKKTLEEIGKKYNITRERVRQVEDAAINFIKKSDAYKREQAVFDELKGLVHKLGSVVAEHELLPYISKDKATQN